MAERPFLNKSSQPTSQTIQSALGNVYPCYEKIMARVSSYAQEWNFTKSSGWMLKIHDRKKALCYLIPLKDSLKISLTLRESEKATFLRDDDLRMMHPAILSAKQYSEGFALQFNISDEKDCQEFEFFIGKLIALRS